jgi:hypothetical protein
MHDDHSPGLKREGTTAAGDPICWLQFVCESCGALVQREGDPHRPDCERAK